MIEPSFHVRTNNRAYPVHVGRNLIAELNQIIKIPAGKIFIITDEIVSKSYLEPVLESLTDTGAEILPKVLPSGESTKTLESAQEIYRFLGENLASKSDKIIALGGGVIGDLSGFVASTFKRGMNLAQVPTTLLAQVDSALGGKTGVNLEWGKNLVGTFYQPHTIVADVLTLRTLTQRQLMVGLAEVIKYGVIMDSNLLEVLKEQKDEILNRKPAVLEKIVKRCLMLKARVVADDEHEQGYRKILNFGHTVGHAIETASELSISHGEAVSIGMVEEARYALKLGMLHESSLELLELLLSDYGLPTEIPSYLTMDEIDNVMKHDKKIRHGKLTLPLLVELGRVQMKIVDGMPN